MIWVLPGCWQEPEPLLSVVSAWWSKEVFTDELCFHLFKASSLPDTFGSWAFWHCYHQSVPDPGCSCLLLFEWCLMPPDSVSAASSWQVFLSAAPFFFFSSFIYFFFFIDYICVLIATFPPPRLLLTVSRWQCTSVRSSCTCIFKKSKQDKICIYILFWPRHSPCWLILWMR